MPDMTEIATFKCEFGKRMKEINIQDSDVFVYTENDFFYTPMIISEDWIHSYVNNLTQQQLNLFLVDYNIKVEKHQREVITGILMKSVGIDW